MHDPVSVDVGPARDQVLVRGRFGETEHGRDTGVGPGEHLDPLGSGSRGEGGRDPLAQLRPGRAVGTVCSRGIDTQAGNERVVERLLECADRDPLAVGGALGGVKRCAAVDEVALRLVGPGASGPQPVNHREHVRSAVDHGGVDDLPGAGLA